MYTYYIIIKYRKGNLKTKCKTIDNMINTKKSFDISKIIRKDCLTIKSNTIDKKS